MLRPKSVAALILDNESDSRPNAPCRCDGTSATLVQCLSHEPNSKHWPSGQVQKLNLPVTVLLEIAGNIAKQIAADFRHLGPNSLAISDVKVGDAGVTVMTDLKKIGRHGEIAFE